MRYGLDDCVFLHSVGKCARVPSLRRLVAGLPPRRPRFDLRSAHVRFVLGRVTQGQVFPPRTSVFPVSVIPPLLHTQLDLHIAYSKRAMPRNVPAAVLCRNLETLDRKVVCKEMCAVC